MTVKETRLHLQSHFQNIKKILFIPPSCFIFHRCLQLPPPQTLGLFSTENLPKNTKGGKLACTLSLLCHWGRERRNKGVWKDTLQAKEILICNTNHASSSSPRGV